MRSLISGCIGVIFFLLSGAVIWFGLYVGTASEGTGNAVVFIPKGSGVRQIKTILGSKGLVGDDVRFLILAQLSGLAGSLRAGEYSIPYGLTPGKVLHILERGEVLQHKITIPEGLTASQIGAIFAEDKWVERERFDTLITDQDFIRTLGLNQQSLEGYLFPDTYTLERNGTDEKAIIRLMIKRFQEVFNVLGEISSGNLNVHQIVTLASIVEKETSVASERPLIARVFLNRLENGMRLQSDPTVIYGLENFTGSLTKSDLKKATLYNTYVIKGLPPGPICNPGLASLKSVVSPAKAKYLYFVSTNEGTHYFSTTLEEHNQAVKKYRKARLREQESGDNGQD